MRKHSRQIWFIVCLAVAVVMVMILSFQICYERAFDLILEKDIQQMVASSKFITKLVENQIENKTNDLQSGAKLFLQAGGRSELLLEKQLETLRQELDMEKLGLADLHGFGMDSAGKETALDSPSLLAAIKEGKSYISDSMDTADCILLAVPLEENGRITGFLWGQYRVSKIARQIEQDENSNRYLQIVDDEGNYISESNSIYSFAENENIWEEMQRYDIRGSSVEAIREDVAQGRSGQFFFRYKGSGRYVTYEPLGINHWYVFSVLTEGYLQGFATEIERMLLLLVAVVICCAALLAGALAWFIFKTTQVIREQNSVLTAKNSLLYLALKHTQDVPFELDLEEKTIQFYQALPDTKMASRSLEDVRPQRLLETGVLMPESFDRYQRLYENVLAGRQTQPQPIHFWVNGRMDVNQVHYEFLDQNRAVGCVEDYNLQSQQDEQIQQIRQQSQVDGLTKLLNRECFQREVDKILAGPRPKEGCALVILDLDNFKNANDTLGHMVGDQILRDTALILKTIARERDLCGRLGGDEFVVFVREAGGRESVQAMAEKTNAVLRRSYENDGKSVDISASLGVAILTTQTTFAQLYRLADKALYRAKNQGKDGSCILQEESPEEI